MTLTPKLLSCLALLALSFAAPAVQSEPVYRFEIRVPDQVEPLTVQAKSGETQTAKATGNSTTYTASTTTIPKQLWLDMVQLGTAPSHDFVTCTKKTCTYGLKAMISDSVNISISPTAKGSDLVVSMVLDVSQSNSTAVPGQVFAPEMSNFHNELSSVMNAGDTLPIANGERVLALVKYVGAE